MPPTPIDRATFAQLTREPAAWRPMVVEVCAAAGVACSDVRAFSDCANLVAAVDEQHIVKLFPSFHRHQWQSERVALRHFDGRLSVRIPRLLGEGERDDGWCWLILDRLPGITLESCWAKMALADQRRLLLRIGATMRAVHQLPLGEVATLEPRWSTFVVSQLAGCTVRHRRLGVPEWLLRDLDRCLVKWRALVDNDPRRVVLTGEYTPCNLLVDKAAHGAQLAGMIDFGDVMVGVPEYDLIGPSLFLCGGKRELVEALLRGYLDGDVRMAHEQRMHLMTLAVLHRYAHFDLQIRIDGWRERARSLEELALLIWPE